MLHFLCLILCATTQAHSLFESSYYHASERAVSCVSEGNTVVVTAHLSGYGKDDINVTITQGILEITPKAPSSKKKKKGEAKGCEKPLPLIELALPIVEIDTVEATMKHGLLTITITKPKAQSMVVKVKEGS